MNVEWDGWPDGDFSRIFPLEFVEAHDNLRVHWACETLGGSGGSAQAETWADGKVTRRRCQGIIECTSRACNIIVRPQTRAKGITKQLSQPCSCGEDLVHYPCNVISTLHTFKDGVHYRNGGFHAHARPTVRLHMSRKERDDFGKIVEQNPAAGPIKLLVGRPGIDGPADSVADITPVLLNVERIRYERRKVLKGVRGHGGDNFIKAFAKFEENHPEFIREAQFGEVTVIVMQTPFMAAKLVKATIDAEAVNGIVSDAAHRVWREANSLLIVSSTYEPARLKCWIPGIMSYANGGTAEHYRIHFFHLFDGMAQECGNRGIDVTDDLFANVLDFSAAERNGFILGFVDFWLKHAPGQRSIDELIDAAEKLLKGCAQHFRNQITRVKKISGVVDPSKTDIFANYARKLLSCETMEEFLSHANDFIAAFPRAESWIRWWMIPAHACMLFPSFRVMNPDLWDSIPATTNAEEAMHWKLYAALGRFLALLEGLKALYKFASHYQRLSDAAAHGVKVFYGRDRQPWKRTAEKFGYTKYSRHHGARRVLGKTKNDGRPPDTGKALMRIRKVKEPDLAVLFAAASRDYSDSLEPMFSGLPPNHPLKDLRQMFHTRRETVQISGYESGGCNLLTTQRDGFRQVLRDVPGSPIKSLSEFSSMFAWLYHITDGRARNIVPEYQHQIRRANSYFRLTSVILKCCTGAAEDHWQLSPISQRSECQLNRTWCDKYGGDMRKWFQDLVRVSKPEALGGCWQTLDGYAFCDGNSSLFEVILNIPVVLIIEMGDMHACDWDVAGLISPYASNPAASAAGVKYNIVGHIYGSHEKLHFITRYLSTSASKKKIFDYDGREHEGHAIRNRTTAMRGCLTGPSQSLTGIPDGYTLYAVLYHLEGGEKAQQFFRKEQITHAQKLGLHFEVDPSSQTGIPSTCEFRRRNVQRIADDDRFWLNGPSSAVDYIGTSRTQSPRKPAANVWHAPMIRPPTGENSDSDSTTSDSKPTTSDSLADLKQKSSPAPNEDEIDKLLLDSIATPDEKPRRRKAPHFEDAQPEAGSRSPSPSPVFCEGCGMQEPDGDSNPDEVQCESCGFWSHIECLTQQENWDDPNVRFICKRCRAQKLGDHFDEGNVVMVPDPRVPNWKAPGVLWYPARFIKRHENRERKPDEYEFEWLQCTDGIIYNSAHSELPPLMLRMFRRARKFCAEIDATKLSANQIGKVRMPFYMNPDHPDHENPELATIFKASLPQIAEMLAEFDANHPVVASYTKYFAHRKEIDRHRQAGEWMRSLALVPTPELEVVLATPLEDLLQHPRLADLLEAERMQKVMGVGSALFQLLAVQHALGEPLNLNGDILDDLAVGRVAPYSTDGPEALTAMFSATPLPALKSGALATRMMQFNGAHTVYDPDLRPPTYYREFPSDSDPTAPIPVPTKRKGGQGIKGEPSSKRVKTESGASEAKKKAATKETDKKSKVKSKPKPKAKSKSKR
ncbi:hypothetical protein B0H13DRAFT_2537126 [Mycena leptocephala]|nr:hypothetical protein B0H13DRAFT_2537126 [Mycena leptocephala]